MRAPPIFSTSSCPAPCSRPEPQRDEKGCAMKALRLIDWKTEPELVEVPKPTPGPGEVVVKIGGAGACHSDLHVMHDFEPGMMPWKVPFTLGHENAGWVGSVADGVPPLPSGAPAPPSRPRHSVNCTP